MNYTLTNPKGKTRLKTFWPFLQSEKGAMAIAAVGILCNAGLNLLGPYLIGHAIDTYIVRHDVAGLSRVLWQLGAVYVGAFLAAYMQTRVMGGVGQRVLWRLRNQLFEKLQELPVAFFAQNKAGDLISRINNDTDKLNQFFSQAIMQFVGNAFMMLGAAIALISLQPTLGVVLLVPATCLLILTQLTGKWMKAVNVQGLSALGAFSAVVQESLENFKVMVAFGRQDYFRSRIEVANEETYQTATRAGIANASLMPVYSFTGNVAQLLAITFGITLVLSGDLTLGVLVSVLSYVSRLYDPMRQIASFWASMQSALAAADRIQQILQLESNMQQESAVTSVVPSATVLAFHNVSFTYASGTQVLRDVNLELQEGKTYAFVGPTGGGKTTTASLMARLYDPTEGRVEWRGRDIRSYSEEERTREIGFILQEPFLLEGTVRDNVVYGNPDLRALSDQALTDRIEQAGLTPLLARFDEGLQSKIGAEGATVSAGQKQLIAFMRALLRSPKLLILDEATANIDTITEQLLSQALERLPSTTTRVVIAHRLNTIERADQIFFVNAATVSPAGSLDEAIEMLMHKHRAS